MILPMMGFLFTLIVVGGLATLVAVGDPKHANIAPFLGFTSLFAGLGALFLSIRLGIFFELVAPSHFLSTLGFFGGYALGGLGGALFGLRMALRRSHRQTSE